MPPLCHLPRHRRRHHPATPPLHGAPHRSHLHPRRRARRVVGALPARRDHGRARHCRPRSQERAGLLRPDRSELATPPRALPCPHAPRRRQPLHPPARRIHGALQRPRGGVRVDRGPTQGAQRHLLSSTPPAEAARNTTSTRRASRPPPSYPPPNVYCKCTTMRANSSHPPSGSSPKEGTPLLLLHACAYYCFIPVHTTSSYLCILRLHTCAYYFCIPVHTTSSGFCQTPL